MVRKQAPSRSDSEWFNLITECRKSGLSDTAWCRVKGIPSGTFFCAVQRLRKKAYALPERSAVTDTTLDLTSRQDVVRIDIEPKPFPAKIPEPVQPQAAAYLDNSHTIEIDIHGVSIRISNDASPVLLQTVLSMIGGAYAG